jgi:hypothetical protein
MDGNTTRFDIWPYKTNTVNMKYDSKEMLWYHPLVQEDIHYISVNNDNIKNKFEFYNGNASISQMVIYNAKKLANNIFRPIVHQMYMVELLQSIALNK